MKKIEYRKINTGDEETYCCIISDSDNFIALMKGFTLHLAKIPFLATSTMKPYSYVSLFPNFSPDDCKPVLMCEDGWGEISEEEYNTILNQIFGIFNS